MGGNWYMLIATVPNITDHKVSWGSSTTAFRFLAVEERGDKTSATQNGQSFGCLIRACAAVALLPRVSLVYIEDSHDI